MSSAATNEPQTGSQTGSQTWTDMLRKTADWSFFWAEHLKISRSQWTSPIPQKKMERLKVNFMDPDHQLLTSYWSVDLLISPDSDRLKHNLWTVLISVSTCFYFEENDSLRTGSCFRASCWDSFGGSGLPVRMDALSIILRDVSSGASWLVVQYVAGCVTPLDPPLIRGCGLSLRCVQGTEGRNGSSS